MSISMTQFMWRKPCLAKLHLKLELWPTTAFVAVYLDPFLPRDLEFVLVQPRPKCLGHHHSHHRSPWDLVATFGALPHRPGNPSPPHPSTMLLPLTTHHSKDVRQSKYRRPDVFWSKRQHGQVEILHQVKSAPGADIFLWNVFPDLFEGSWHVIKKKQALTGVFLLDPLELQLPWLGNDIHIQYSQETKFRLFITLMGI